MIHNWGDGHGQHFALKESPHFADYTEVYCNKTWPNWLAGKILFPGRIPVRFIALRIPYFHRVSKNRFHLS